MPRGGRRSGTVGKSFSNRSDMNDGRIVLPPKTVTGQTYGEAKTQLDAQRQTPMASAAVSNVPAPSGPPAPAGLPTMPAPQGPPPTGPLPGELPGLHLPTVNPTEHVMTGVPQGPGGGPEVMGQSPASAQTVGAFLAALAAQPGAPADIQALAAMTRSRS